MSLPLLERDEWESKILAIKKQYPNLHLFYSSIEGWCYISYGSQRIKVSHRDSLQKIIETIESLLI